MGAARLEYGSKRPRSHCEQNTQSDPLVLAIYAEKTGFYFKVIPSTYKRFYPRIVSCVRNRIVLIAHARLYCKPETASCVVTLVEASTSRHVTLNSLVL